MSIGDLVEREFWPLTIFLLASTAFNLLELYYIFSVEKRLKNYNHNMDYFREVISNVLTMLSKKKKD